MFFRKSSLIFLVSILLLVFLQSGSCLYAKKKNSDPKTPQEYLDEVFDNELKLVGLKQIDHGGYTKAIRDGKVHITVFKAPDPKKEMSWVVAIHSPKINLGETAHVPGPLGKFELSDILIILSEKVKKIDPSNMPDNVRKIAKKTYLTRKNKTLVHGANFFANIPLTTKKSKFLDLINKVFTIDRKSVMISGGFDFDILLNLVTGKNKTEKKDGSGLNLAFTLPTPGIKGLKSIVTLDDIEIDLSIPSGARTHIPILSGTSGISIHFPSHKVHLPSINFKHFTTKPKTGMPYISFDGNAKGLLNSIISRLHIPGFKTKNLDFTFAIINSGNKKKNYVVEIGITGDVNLFGLNLKFIYSAGKDGFELKIPDAFKLKQLLGPLPLSFLKTAEVKNITITNGLFSGTLLTEKKEFPIVLFQQGDGKIPGIAIEIDSFSLSDFSSMVKGTILDKFSLKNIVLICMPPHCNSLKLSPNMKGGVFKKIFKGKTAELLNGTKLESGITLCASTDLSKISILKKALKILGLEVNSVPMLATIPSSGGKGRFLVDLPAIKPPHTPKFIKFGKTRFEAGVINGKFETTFDMPVSIDTSIIGHTHGNPSSSSLNLDGGIDLSALAHGDVKLELGPPSDSNGITWHHPFGISWLQFDNVIPNIVIDGKNITVKFSGKFKNPASNKFEEVDIMLSEKNEKLDDYRLSLPDSKIGLGMIPMFKSIPGLNHLYFKGITLSKKYLQGTMKFKKIKTTATAFKDNSGSWNIVAECDLDLKLGDLINLNKLPIKNIKFPNPKFFISTNGYSGKGSSIPSGIDLSGKAVGKKIKSTGSKAIVQMAKGLNLMGIIDPKKLPAAIKKGLKVIGIVNKVEITGGISGIFSGRPSFSLSGPLPVIPVSKFKFFGKTHNTPYFFLSLDVDGNTEFGYRSLIEIKEKNSKPLVFEVDFGLKMSEEPEVYVSAEMTKGTWKHPFGIHGFSLTDPYLKLGFVAEGEFDLCIGGTSHFAGKDLLLIADAKFLLDAGGLPDAVAFAGSLNSLSLSDFIKGGSNCASAKKKKINHKGLPVKNIGFKDVAFAFMTPGASLPPKYEKKFHIEGAGIALAGKVLLNGNELGEIKGYCSTEGLYIDSMINAFKIGPVHTEKSEFKVKAVTNISTPPELYIKGGVNLFSKKDKIDLKLVIEENDLEFETELKIGKLVDIQLGAKTLHGFSFSPDNDFSMHASMNSNFMKAFKKLLTGKVSKGLSDLDSKYKDSIKDLNKKEKNLKSIKKKIDARQKEVDHKMAKLKKPFNDAVKKLNKLNKEKKHFMHDYHYYKKKKKNCSKWRIDKKAYYEGKADWNWTKAKGLNIYIKTAKALVSSTGTAITEAGKHTDPKLVLLQSEYGTAKAAFETAKTFMEGLDATNNGINQGIKDISKGVSPFEITSIKLGGSLSGFIGKGKNVPYLDIDMKIHGKRKKIRLSCNIQFLEHFGEKLAGKIEKKLEEDFNKTVNKIVNEALKFYKK